MDGKIFYSLEEGIMKVKKGWFYISYNSILFPIFVNIKYTNYLEHPFVIFVPGSTRREKPLPIFQRSYFAENIDANVICIADPTLHFRKNITMAWFCGDRHYHYASIIGRILFLFLNKMKVSNILVYGTSAGGIPSLHISNQIKNCKCYIGNAQLNVFDYYNNHKERLFENVFRNLDEQSIKEKFGNRINLVNFTNEFELVVTQNLKDEHHYLKHFLPFIQSINKNNSAFFYTYDDEESGHNVLPKETELKIINCLINDDFESIVRLLPHGKLIENEIKSFKI